MSTVKFFWLTAVWSSATPSVLQVVRSSNNGGLQGRLQHWATQGKFAPGLGGCVLGQSVFMCQHLCSLCCLCLHPAGSY